MPLRTVKLLILCCSLMACHNPTTSAKIDAELSKTLLRLHNEARQAGISCADEKQTASRLKWNSELAKLAARHSRDMYNNKQLSHRSKNGWSAQKRLNKSDYKWQAFAENLARGDDPQSVFNGWIASNKHCINIVNPRYQEMGGAMVDGYWTMLLAQPKHGR